MCGIIGSVGFSKSLNLKDLNVIKHRGPDNTDFINNSNIFLGHQRLSIIDTSLNGNQPMTTADGNYTIIFNGEIYNHLEIRDELLNLGIKFNSSSDTETLLYGFSIWGLDVLKKLNGIFAFSIFDKKLNKIFVVRDQFGIKPLYYFNSSEIFCFSSELKALKKIFNIENELNFNNIFFYLQTLYGAGNITPFKNLFKLLPGHFIEYDINLKKMNIKKYYQNEFQNKLVKTEEDVINDIDKLLNDAVKRQLMSDVPIGFFLSGGLDSSLIVAIAKKHLKKNNLECFTIRTGTEFINEGFTDDEFYAKKVANYLNVNLNIIDSNDFMKPELFDKTIWHLDEPQSDPAAFHVKAISDAARKKGIKVLVGGTAGDDIFSGYRRHQAIYYNKFLESIPQFLKIYLKRIFDKIDVKKPLFRRFKKYINNIDLIGNKRIANYFMWADQKIVLKLLSKKVKSEIDIDKLPIEYYSRLIDNRNFINDLDKILFLELSTFLPDHNLNYTDKMSMASGVEVRVPFLDIDLVKYVNKLPNYQKMKGKKTKYILRKVAERYLPKEIIYRPKTGFGSPIRKLIKEEYKEKINDFLKKGSLFKNEILDKNEVKKLIKNNNEDKIDASYLIWALLSLESWYNHFKK